jgi:hypothetical protein
MDLPSIPDLSSNPTGDMPGDQVQITQQHLKKAQVIFPRLWKLLQPLLDGSPPLAPSSSPCMVAPASASPRSVPCSPTSCMSAGSAPTSCPATTTASHPPGERRGAGRGPRAAARPPLLATYFDQVNRILASLRNGAPTLQLKRMGRAENEVWYETVDLSSTRVIILEWTHGNNANVTGVDIPILLNSTPEETLAHRRSRARDGAVDSPFTTTVLELEQALLHSQAGRARIIVSKSGELIDYDGSSRTSTARSRCTTR